ncbi:MAG: hypothetical protein EOP10_01785 [Proteobacteria bacterium]|nr:MAG: hypothetical protein EOP10_01785 [Pseudomonadota bacterium]
MRIFPKFRFAEVEDLNPQNILAGLLLAVKGQATNEVELMHLSSNLAGPQSDNYMVKADDLKRLIQTSTRILDNLGLDAFVEQASDILTDRQKLASLVTIMDVCMMENSLLEGEKAIFDKVREGFGISEDELRPFEEMLILKNESSIRLNVLPSSYNRAAEGFRSLV